MMLPTSAEIPSHRACSSCRNQKVRCIIDDASPDICQRCSRSGRPCVFTPLQKRKQRKRTDTRVAELEREMRAMRAALREKEQEQSSELDRSNLHQHQTGQRGDPFELRNKDRAPGSLIWDSGLPGDEQAKEGDVLLLNSVQQAETTLWGSMLTRPPRDVDAQDVIDRGILSMATARHLFESYRNDLFPHYPMVPIPDSTMAEDMRSTKPALFLAIIAAAAAKENAELSAALDKEVLQAYATRSLVQSEKSLELVQALLISAVWYNPPNKFGQLKYYEYIHMAATMALDIGIGSRPSTMQRTRFKQQEQQLPRRMTPRALTDDNLHPIEDISNPDLSMAPRSHQGPSTSSEIANVESRRTFLACYFMCAGVSLSLRRPNLLRVSSYIRECVDYVGHSPHAISTDQTLTAWVRLIMIADEIGSSLSYDDMGEIASFSDLRTRLMLKDFERRLSEWYRSVPETHVGMGSLLIMYYTVRIYLFEIALHVDHSPEDFRAPYQMGSIHRPPPHADDPPTQALAEAVAECIASSHALFDTFLVMDVDSLRGIPVFGYVRISFAAFVLAKLCLSAAHPESRIGRILDRNSLKAERYLDSAILHVRGVVGTKRGRTPSIFLALLFKLRHWCLNPEIVEEQPKDAVEVELHNSRGTSLRQNRIGDSVDLYNDATESIVRRAPPQTQEQLRNKSSKTPQANSISIADDPSVPSLAIEPPTTPNLAQHGFEDKLVPMPELKNKVSPEVVLQQTAVHHNNDGRADAMPDWGESSSSGPLTGNDPWDLAPMDLDSGNLTNLLSEIDPFPEGGLTGLDDWASVPLDFANMKTMDWAMSPDGRPR